MRAIHPPGTDLGVRLLPATSLGTRHPPPPPRRILPPVTVPISAPVSSSPSPPSPSRSPTRSPNRKRPRLDLHHQEEEEEDESSFDDTDATLPLSLWRDEGDEPLSQPAPEAQDQQSLALTQAYLPPQQQQQQQQRDPQEQETQPPLQQPLQLFPLEVHSLDDDDDHAMPGCVDSSPTAVPAVSAPPPPAQPQALYKEHTYMGCNLFRDLIISTRGHAFHVHKCAVAEKCQVLYDMLEITPSTAEIPLPVGNNFVSEDPQDVKLFLQAIYDPCLAIPNTDKLITLVKYAIYYNCANVQQRCELKLKLISPEDPRMQRFFKWAAEFNMVSLMKMWLPAMAFHTINVLKTTHPEIVDLHDDEDEEDIERKATMAPARAVIRKMYDELPRKTLFDMVEHLAHTKFNSFGQLDKLPDTSGLGEDPFKEGQIVFVPNEAPRHGQCHAMVMHSTRSRNYKIRDEYGYVRTINAASLHRLDEG